MPTEVQIYKDGTIAPADLSTGGPNWDTSGNLTATSFNGTATGLSGTPNITVGTVTATSFKTSTASTGFLKADGNVDTNTYITQAVPVGAVFHFAASTAPTGYLKANGDHIPNGVGEVQGVTANFSALYEILGNTYGLHQDFRKLPDLRGEFIRGWNDGKATDSGRVFGSPQDDAFQNIVGVLGNMWGFEGDGTSGALSSIISGSSNQPGTGGNLSRAVSFNAANSIGARTATETRPRNIALLACIKY